MADVQTECDGVRKFAWILSFIFKCRTSQFLIVSILTDDVFFPNNVHNGTSSNDFISLKKKKKKLEDLTLKA